MKLRIAMDFNGLIPVAICLLKRITEKVAELLRIKESRIVGG